MKKSEAIKIIEDVLRHPYDYPAVTILMKLEEAGMLPPSRQALSWSELGIDSPNDSEQPRFTVCKWESENEKK